jgi:hypothetical protein
VRCQAEKEKPQRAFIHRILTVLREEVKEFNRTAKSGENKNKNKAVRGLLFTIVIVWSIDV